MLDKLDLDWLHYIREVEADKVIRHLPAEMKTPVLEIGCGDGFQTLLLRKKFKSVVATERYAPSGGGLLKSYILCDACHLPFKDGIFGMVYSSNVLEHIKNRHKALEEMKRVTCRNAVMVHNVPTAFWKIMQFFLHYLGMTKIILNRIRTPVSLCEKEAGGSAQKKSGFRKILHYLRLAIYPSVHGVYRWHAEEFWSYQRRQWEKLFKTNNLVATKVLKLYTYSPYFLMRFKFKAIRNLLSYIGMTSCYSFILEESENEE